MNITSTLKSLQERTASCSRTLEDPRPALSKGQLWKRKTVDEKPLSATCLAQYRRRHTSCQRHVAAVRRASYADPINYNVVMYDLNGRRGGASVHSAAAPNAAVTAGRPNSPHIDDEAGRRLLTPGGRHCGSKSRHHLLPTSDDSDGGLPEDERLGIGVDRQHEARPPHADHVIELAG